ncbi:hypothetical protein [Pseudomonas sp. SDO55104_S430]
MTQIVRHYHTTHETAEKSQLFHSSLRVSEFSMTTNKHTCGALLARINGRTLSAVLKKNNHTKLFERFSKTQWVHACPFCDAATLSAGGIPWPFACSDGVMRTSSDFNTQSRNVESEDLDFCGFRFSRTALNSAIRLARIEFDTTEKVEKIWEGIAAGEQVDVLVFSEEVCRWGDGQRVWGNLGRLNNKDELESALEKWLKRTPDLSDEEAIAEGIKIRGLRVSFASKHLRMVDPDKYAVLDEVLSEGLGFALNAKGYRLFLTSLRNFSSAHSISVRLAELEAGIFLLVRQMVRSTDLNVAHLTRNGSTP